MGFKKRIEIALIRFPVLYQIGSKIYHRIFRSFRTLSPGAPDAIFKSFLLAKELNNNTIGDYYEFGVFRGYTFLSAYRACQTLHLESSQFFGFDSFEGLPSVAGIDRGEGQFFKGQFACSKSQVENNIEANGMDMTRTYLVEGFYEQSLTEDLRTQLPFKAASVVLFDCDLYSSTKVAIDWAKVYFQNYTILLFDDWYSYGGNNKIGQQRAFNEFLRDNPQYIAKELWEFEKHGKSFILLCH